MKPKTKPNPPAPSKPVGRVMYIWANSSGTHLTDKPVCSFQSPVFVIDLSDESAVVKAIADSLWTTREDKEAHARAVLAALKGKQP